MPKRKGIQSTEELREDLECPVCFVIPRSGPIYQCEAGHIHCKSCHPQLQECPVCRGPIRGNLRSLMTEKIIAKLPTKCAFAEYGCLEDEKLPHDMLCHEKDCFFRLLKCKWNGCNENVPVSDFAEHHRMKHDSTVLDAVKEPLVELYFKGLRFKPVFIRSKKHTFAFTVRRCDDHGYLSFYVFIIGSTADIQKEEYRCTIKITNLPNYQINNSKSKLPMPVKIKLISLSLMLSF